jgi:hypothetical protein
VLARRTSSSVKPSIQPAGAAAADFEDLLGLQVEVAALAFGQHLHGVRPGREVLRSRVEFDSSVSFTGIYLGLNQFIKG